MFLNLNLFISKIIINTIQATINRFIWKVKPPRVKAKIIQQSIRNGGVATPNILAYYYQAVHLVALTQWWAKDIGRCDCPEPEQDSMKLPLHEWVSLDKSEKTKHQNANWTIRQALIKEIKETVAPEWWPIVSFFTTRY